LNFVATYHLQRNNIPKKLKSLSALNKYIRKYWLSISIGIACVVLNNYFSIFIPVFVRQGIDDALMKIQLIHADQSHIVSNNLIWNAIGFGLAIFLVSILKGIFLYYTRQTLIVTSRKIEFDQKNELYHKYQRLGESFFRKNYTGDMMSRITEDISNVRMYIGPSIMYYANMLFSFVMILTQMFMVNSYLTMWVLIPLPFLSYSIYKVSDKINRGSKQIQEQLSVITTKAQETFAGIRIIKSFGVEENFARDFQDAGLEYRKRALELAKINALFFPLMALLMGLSTIIVFYVGGREVQNGRFTAGNVAEFIIYLNMLIWPVASLGWTTALVQKAAASQKRINDFLSEEEYIGSGHRPFQFDNTFSFNQINHQYPAKNHLALKNISLTINKGDFLGVVGKTGAGKSTLLQIITRQLEPSNGELKLDGIHLNDFDLVDYRNHIAYVPQDVFLFSETIRENILFGLVDDKMSPEKIQEKLSQAVQLAHLTEDLEQLPNGIETIIGERGVSLSGGQKQRLSLARALMRDAEILILDDCLSAVDAHTEKVIIEHLRNYAKGKTVVMSTHRIAAITQATKILVLTEGKLDAIDTHSELVKSNDFYSWLNKNQVENH
jgi:ATP-binding cassette, subfamily B, multidrug efflux pump